MRAKRETEVTVECWVGDWAIITGTKIYIPPIMARHIAVGMIHRLSKIGGVVKTIYFGGDVYMMAWE